MKRPESAHQSNFGKKSEKSNVCEGESGAQEGIAMVN
jgi:hypothetical protein